MKIAQEHELLSYVATALPQARRVLVFAPHPDDEIFACAGILALLREQGADLTVHILTNGARGGDNRAGNLVAARMEESRCAAAVLGFPPPVFWGLEDRGLVYGEPLVGQLIDLVYMTDADLIVAPAPTELHPDHQALAFAVAGALGRIGGDRQVLFCELGFPLPNPNLVIDITRVAERKLAAMRCFDSQIEEQPYELRVTGLNQYRAHLLGSHVASAEAFQLVSARLLEQDFAALFESPLTCRQRMGFRTTPDQHCTDQQSDQRLQCNDRERELELQLQQVSLELTALYASRSWFLTAPLRRCGTCLRTIIAAFKG